MKRRFRGIITLLIACVLIAGAFGACAKESKDDSKNQNTNTAEGTGTTDLSGTITMAGSTSMEKVATVMAEGFMARNSGVVVSPEFTGSGAGIEALIAGTIEIGNSSRALTDEEKSAGAVENIICLDGIAVIVDPKNTATNLTKDQLTQIYTGAVTNWSEVGGTDQPIVVVGREAGSGTRGAFEELLGTEDLCKYSNEISSTGAVLAKVASTPGAIGYVSLDVVDDTVIAVSLDGVAATAENVKTGTYLLQRPFVMATMGEISTQNELVQAFFGYLKSTEGQELIKSAGLITVD